MNKFATILGFAGSSERSESRTTRDRRDYGVGYDWGLDRSGGCGVVRFDLPRGAGNVAY